MTLGFPACLARLEAFVGKSEAECGIPPSSSFTEVCSTLLSGIVEGSETRCDEELSDCIQCCVVEAVRMNLSTSQLEEELKPLRSPLTDALLKAYESRHVAIKDHMNSIGWRPSDVEAVDWRLIKVVQNKTNGDANEIRAELTIRTSDGEATRLLCNRDELFDLQWKVNEARNLISKLPK